MLNFKNRFSCNCHFANEQTRHNIVNEINIINCLGLTGFLTNCYFHKIDPAGFFQKADEHLLLIW